MSDNYYKTYRRGAKRRAQRGRRHRHGCLSMLALSGVRLLCFLLVLAIIALAALWALPPSFLNIEPSGSQLALNADLPGSRANILLLGLDFLNETEQRSDSMIVASVGYKDVRLTSFMRDTMVDVPGKGRHKLNSAFAYGGADLAMRTINDTFGLNITNYIAVDFATMVDLVDAVGGIDIEIEERELTPMNNGAADACKKVFYSNPTKYARYANAQAMTESGSVHLNGIFAVGYSRIRSVGADYQRTSRQRKVISAIVDKMRQNFYDPRMYAELIRVYQESVQTNLTLPELLSLAEKIVLSGSIETYRVPQDEFAKDNGSSIEITDLNACRSALRDFIYSDKV